MKRFLIAYRYLLVLLWLLIILIVFKITTNFVFQNGNSLLFLFLLVSFPLFLYVYTLCNTKATRKKRIQKENGYFKRIEEDFQNGHFETYFLKRLKDLGIKGEEEKLEDKVQVQISKENEVLFYLSLQKEQAILHLEHTQIDYHFYYASCHESATKYDFRNLQYKDTKILYIKIIERVESLLHGEYVYEQNKKQITLRKLQNQEIVYLRKVEKDMKRQMRKEKFILSL